ncbi:MAG: mechanosensitive ion channel domain-containing protein [Cyanobacteria bacterium P01_F01_bin.143]
MLSENKLPKNCQKKARFRFLRKGIFIVVLLLVACFVTPVIAQTNNFPLETFPLFNLDFANTTTKAAIAIDDQEIFQVSRTEQLTASERAEKINAALKIAIASSQQLDITIQQRNKLPVIYLNDRHLLTIINDDLVDDNSSEQQAEIWADKLEEAIKEARLARNPQEIQERAILAVIVFLVAIALDKLIRLLRYYSLIKAFSKLLPGTKLDNLEPHKLKFLLKLRLILARVILWFTTIYWISDLFPASRHWRNVLINFFSGSFSVSLFSLGDRAYSLFDLLILAALFWGLFIATQTITTFLRTKILHQMRMNRSSQEVISIIVKYGLIVLGTIILLQIWGVNLSSLAILGSALGVGIGFGLQDITKNFASGLVLLFERSVQIGDFIEVNGNRGIVEKIQARSIVLKTLDRVSIVVPNSRLLADDVINWNHENPISRFALPVGVAYSCNPEIVKEILLQGAKEHQEVLDYPQPQVFFTGFGESSLDFNLMIWINEPSRQAVIKSELYFKIERLLREHTMEIPFPQRDLYLRGSVPLGLSPELETAFKRWLNDSTSQVSENGNK